MGVTLPLACLETSRTFFIFTAAGDASRTFRGVEIKDVAKYPVIYMKINPKIKFIWPKMSIVLKLKTAKYTAHK